MILCVRTAPLAILAARRRSPALIGRPLVLGGLPHERLMVLAASEEAQSAGVVVGMPLREAEQRCPNAVFQAIDAEAVTQLHRALLSVLYGFTPQVAPADDDGCIFMKLDGLTLRWPDRARLLAVIAQRVQDTLSSPPGLGVGVNRFVSALAARRAGLGGTVVVEPAQTLAFLAPLPVSVLPLDDEIREYLDLLGLRTLGSVQALTRPAWHRQFGPGALGAYDLACGIDHRPLRFWHPPARLAQTMPLDPPIDNIEALQFVLRTLTDRLAESLMVQALGTRRVVLRLDQEGAPRIEVDARFAYPVTAPADLFAGVRAQLLRVRPAAPLERLTLTLRQLEPAYVRQPGLLLRGDGQQESLADAVLRLQERYRPELVQRAGLVASAPPLADRRIAWSPA